MNDGRKDDAQKPRWTLLPWRAMARVVDAANTGPQPNGTAAAMDHISAVLRGEPLREHMPSAILALMWALEAPGSPPRPMGKGWAALPWRALSHVVGVLEYGARKYGPDNWRRVENLRERYTNAALRHIARVMSGEWIDEDSGEPNLACAITSLAFVLEDAEISAAAPSITDRAEAAAQRATLDGLTMMAAREAMTSERRTTLRPDGWDELRGEGPRSEVQF